MAEWFHAKFDRLNGVEGVDKKRDLLAEIKIKFGGLNISESGEVSRNIDLGHLFSQLIEDDSGLTDELCDISKTMVAVLEPGEICQRYPEEILKLISHPNPTVKSFILNEILRAASISEKVPELIRDINLLHVIINSIADDDLEVAKIAMSILMKVGEDANGINSLFTEESMAAFNKLIVKNSTISFRVYEVIVDVAKSSKDGLTAAAQSGFLDNLTRTLDSDDILLQLNALEVTTPLAVTEEGLNYLEQQGVLGKLVQKVAKANEDPLSNLLIPGLMKFFGNVAKYWPNEIFSKYPIVVSALFEVIDNGDQAILASALDTLGYVASTVEGKYALCALGTSMTCALKKIGEIIQKMPTDLRIRGLTNLGMILNVKKNQQDNRILSLTKSWFDSLCENPLELIVSLSKQPFSDIRQAALEVLIVVASQTWGQEYIAASPGLTEFLLDRNLEAFKECKDAKYEVVKCLSEAESNIFDAPTMQKFKHYAKEGPHFVETETEVATEGAS